MLKERVLTAIILAVGFLAALFLLPWVYFSVGIGCVLVVATWEWSNLSALSSHVAKAVYIAFVIAVAIVGGVLTDWAQDLEALRYMLIGSCVWWAIALLWIQGFPSSAIIWGSVPARLLMGVFVLVPAWLGVVFLRHQEAGAWLVLFVVLLVASADIGAYFTGRAIGKRKLAPNVSPGKSWEGVAGGAVLAAILAVVFNAVFSGGALLSLLIIAVPTALISVVGDLLESMVKRHQGVKDSSQLLPGHGGVLDRIDALVAAIPVFALALMSSHWQL
ncbi:MAG: phosphatidate cytidylyltransferase [Agarilytica sp.]